jgi:hypothetical protein
VDESPRWLLTRQREKKAIAILRYVGKANKGENSLLPENIHFNGEGFGHEVWRTAPES